MRKRLNVSNWTEGIAINTASSIIWLILTVLGGIIAVTISNQPIWALIISLVITVVGLSIVTWSQHRRLTRLTRLMRGDYYHPLNLGADQMKPMWDHPDLPKGKIWLRNVLFDIKTDGQSHLSGITVAPTESNELRAVNIDAVMMHVERVYFLLNVAHGLRVNPADNLEWEGRSVGSIRLVFRDNTYYETSLILGKNIRDWAPGNQPIAVFKLNDPYASEVWRSADDRSAFDMLQIDIPQAPRDLTRIVVSAQFDAPKNAKTSSLVEQRIQVITDEKDRSNDALIVQQRIIEETFPQIHIIAATCQTSDSA